MEEITGELEILAAIRKGQQDVKAGRVKSHEEVERTLDEWISKESGRIQPFTICERFAPTFHSIIPLLRKRWAKAFWSM